MKGTVAQQGEILIVDDDDLVRRAASRALRAAGFRVTTAASGREALEVVAREPQRFQLVLLDLTMPDMDGEETFGKLRAIHPDQKVLIVSGGAPDAACGRLREQGVCGFLGKPLTLNALVGEITRFSRG